MRVRIPATQRRQGECHKGAPAGMEWLTMRDGMRRRGAVGVAVLLSGMLTLGACSLSGGSGDSDAKGADPTASQSASDAAQAADTSAAQISITPGDMADNVAITDGVSVSVTDGTLDTVTMKATDSGTEVAGTISADGTGWTPDGQLSRATHYELAVRASDSQGRQAHQNATFTTISPDNSFIGNFTPEDGSTVGVGMPVSLNFDKEITDKAAVEGAVEINTSSGQDVVGHWFGDKRLDFRPQNYWEAGTHVTVTLDFNGLEAAPGITGVQDRTFSFDVGRSQISTVDAATHQMTVVRDGRTLKTVPISSGSDENPTYNGAMVISEKYDETRMNGATVGFTDSDGKGEYDIPDVPHAMRLSNSGTFIHGNYWSSTDIFGNTNTSHGCVGLADAQGADDPGTDGAWFYEQSLLGDVVVVVNSPDQTIQPDNGLNGWNMDWNQWVAGSAL
ncbi:L,D-transpeptidase 2 [Streptomyces sp. enrichment culture]